MSAPTSSHSAPATMPSPRAIPPYAGPVLAGATDVPSFSVGPFVPSALRTPAPWAPSSGAAPAMPPATFAVAEAPVALIVPAAIPPYRPFRPAPIVAPAPRTPLYIPPAHTPVGEVAVDDAGTTEPQLVPVAEAAVPSPIADGSAVAPDVSALPWIDAFLASTPALAMPAVDQAVGEQGAGEQGDAPHDEPVADTWPLEEAAAEFLALRAALDAQAIAGSAAPGATAVAGESPAPRRELPAWSDDDMIDIMPVRLAGASRRADVSSATSTAEEAAHALELLARRVRAGELTLPSYDPRMGEPAALVAALAALLGVRLH